MNSGNVPAGFTVNYNNPSTLMGTNIGITGFDVTALSSGDPAALLETAGVSLPAGIDANSLKQIAAGDYSGLNLNALTGGAIPDGIDLGVI
jgi:hypothetical protein